MTVFGVVFERHRGVSGCLWGSSLRRSSPGRQSQPIRATTSLWPLLSEVFPEVFSLPAVPLAIGIHNQILAVAGDSIDPDELGAFMRYWTTCWSYRTAVWRGVPRRNLDGSPAGVPTIEQRNDAARQLWGERAQLIAEPGHA